MNRASIYDLTVIGTETAGRVLAARAAATGLRVALIASEEDAGDTGASVLRRVLERVCHSPGGPISWEDVRGALRTKDDAPLPADVDLWPGPVRFARRDLLLTGRNGEHRLKSAATVLAVGTRSLRPAYLPWSDRRIVDFEGLLRLPDRPASAVIAGGGLFGLGTAAVLSRLGVRVMLVDGRQELAREESVGGMSAERLLELAGESGVQFCLGEEVIGIGPVTGPFGARLSSGVTLPADLLIATTGRQGNTEQLQLACAGLDTDDCGRVWTDHRGRTTVQDVFAIGDVAVSVQAAEGVDEVSAVLGALFEPDWPERGCGEPTDGPRLSLFDPDGLLV